MLLEEVVLVDVLVEMRDEVDVDVGVAEVDVDEVVGTREDRCTMSEHDHCPFL